MEAIRRPKPKTTCQSSYSTSVTNPSVVAGCYQKVTNTASGGQDMRPPHIVSPGQTAVPQTVMQSSTVVVAAPNGIAGSAGAATSSPTIQTNATTITQQQHLPRVQPPPSQPTRFFGHDPGVAGSVQPEMCLIGCYFVVIEHEKVLVDRLDLQEIGAVVRLHGGEIEFGVRSYNNINSERITHIICESMRHQLVQQALKERKRCVTLQWLNDVLTKKHLEPPWRVFHLPTYWAENHRPAAGKIIAMNGFNDTERCGIRMMITAIGGRFTPYLTKHNHFLVSKTLDGEKVERCRELGIPVVTYQWLVELYLGIKTAIIENDTSYTPVAGMIMDTNTTPYSIEHYSEICKQLLSSWASPIIFSNEQWQRAIEVKRTVENDENIFPNRRLRMTTPPPTIEEIEIQCEKISSCDNVPSVCFSGFTPEEKDNLSRKVRFLGAKVTDSVVNCTHLVVLNLWRTFKLLEAIALGKNIVGANWIIDGYRCRFFPDTLDYFAQDEENEKVFGYNLKYSVLKARHHKLFEGVTFYLTPSVEPSYVQLSTLITHAGGNVLRDKPQPQLVIQCIETDTPLLLIGNDSDIHLLQYLTDCGMPVFNVEMILTGILRQKLENSPLYRVAPLKQTPQPSPTPSSQRRSNPSNQTQRAAS